MACVSLLKREAGQKTSWNQSIPASCLNRGFQLTRFFLEIQGSQADPAPDPDQALMQAASFYILMLYSISSIHR